MNPNRQRLLNHCTAATAHLGCIARVNQYDHTTSVLSFVRGVLYQLTPSSIRNAFCQAAVLKHVLLVQLFKGNRAKTVYQFPTQFMSKVFPPIGDALLNMLNSFSTFRSFGSSLLCLREFALYFGKFPFISAKEAWIINLHPVGEGGKTFKPNINSNGLVVEWEGFDFYFTSKTGIPIANRISLNGERFYPSFYGAMKNNFHCSNFRKEQAVVQQFKAELFEGETIVPTITPKAWIAWLLACLRPAKERLESPVNPILNILQNLREHVFQFWMFPFPDGEQFISVVQRKRFLILFPRIFSSGKCFVVDPTAKFQRLNKFRSLTLGWSEAILEGFHKRSSAVHLGSLLVFNVLLQDSNRSTANGRDKIRMCPQGWQSTFQVGKLSTKQMRANAFDPLHKLMHSELWVNFAKEGFIHTANQHLAVILRTKDSMILQEYRT